MTSELRPAVEVAIRIHGYAPFGEGTKAAAAVIEADREAVRAEQAAEIERLLQELTGAAIREEQDRQTIDEQAAELAKFKALAETLAGALGAGTRFMPPSATVWHREAAKALRQYKEARDER